MLAEPVMDFLIPKPFANGPVDFEVCGVEIESDGAALVVLPCGPAVGEHTEIRGGVILLWHVLQGPGRAAPAHQLRRAGVAQSRDQFGADLVAEQMFGVVQHNRLTAATIAVFVEL
jgi:hypothetical protein